jgi:hypothetical protein
MWPEDTSTVAEDTSVVVPDDPAPVLTMVPLIAPNLPRYLRQALLSSNVAMAGELTSAQKKSAHACTLFNLSCLVLPYTRPSWANAPRWGEGRSSPTTPIYAPKGLGKRPRVQCTLSTAFCLFYRTCTWGRIFSALGGGGLKCELLATGEGYTATPPPSGQLRSCSVISPRSASRYCTVQRSAESRRPGLPGAAERRTNPRPGDKASSGGLRVSKRGVRQYVSSSSRRCRLDSNINAPDLIGNSILKERKCAGL